MFWRKYGSLIPSSPATRWFITTLSSCLGRVFWTNRAPVCISPRQDETRERIAGGTAPSFSRAHFLSPLLQSQFLSLSFFNSPCGVAGRIALRKKDNLVGTLQHWTCSPAGSHGCTGVNREGPCVLILLFSRVNNMQTRKHGRQGGNYAMETRVRWASSLSSQLLLPLCHADAFFLRQRCRLLDRLRNKIHNTTLRRPVLLQASCRGYSCV